MSLMTNLKPLCTDAVYKTTFEIKYFIDIFYIYNNKILEIYGINIDNNKLVNNNINLIRKITRDDIGYANGDLAGFTIDFINGDILQFDIDINYVIDEDFFYLFAKNFCNNKCQGYLKTIEQKYKKSKDTLKLSLNRSRINYNPKVIHDIYEYL